MEIKYDIRHNKTVGANVYFNADEFILFYKILSDFVHPKLPNAADIQLGEEMYAGIPTPEEYKQGLKGESMMNTYYKFNDGYFTYYVNTLTGEKKFELEEGDIEVESNFDDFSRTGEKGEPNE